MACPMSEVECRAANGKIPETAIIANFFFSDDRQTEVLAALLSVLFTFRNWTTGFWFYKVCLLAATAIPQLSSRSRNLD